MPEGSDAYEEALRLIENPDYYKIFDALVHFESNGVEMEFSLNEVEIQTSNGEHDKRGIIRKGRAKIVVSLDGYKFGDYQIWRVTPSEKIRGIDSLTVEKKVKDDV